MDKHEPRPTRRTAASDDAARFLPSEFRLAIEREYYERVDYQARVEQLALNSDFTASPADHVALYSDHGVVHVRDVAKQVLSVLGIARGVLIPDRSDTRFEFMKGYGVAVAYLHDIGMRDFSHFGREMHPEFASHEVYRESFDDWIAQIWDENWGNLAWRLTQINSQGGLSQEPRLVLREMLSMANCHSKSRVPVDTLNDRVKLRAAMQSTLQTGLPRLYLRRQRQRIWQQMVNAANTQEDEEIRNELASQLRKADEALADDERSAGESASGRLSIAGHYTHFEHESFTWLVSDHEAARILADDVIDTLRTLRCADALRQRGTVLRTSGGYEVFVDRKSGNAIYAFREANTGRTVLLETDSVIPAGEANIAGTEITADGDLRIAFHRGSFSNQGATDRAARNASLIVNDVQADIIESFRRGEGAGGNSQNAMPHGRQQTILIESVDDNLDFAFAVRRHLETINTKLVGKSRVVPSLHAVTIQERNRYLHSPAAALDENEKRRILDEMAKLGHKTSQVKPETAFIDVRCCRIKPGEVLVTGHQPASFVYVPMGEGLEGTPLGGYDSFPVSAWVPLMTGVVRGAERNATIRADRPVNVLMIPKEVFLREWHKTYSLQEFAENLSVTAAGSTKPDPADTRQGPGS